LMPIRYTTNYLSLNAQKLRINNLIIFLGYAKMLYQMRAIARRSAVDSDRAAFTGLRREWTCDARLASPRA
jgi:hypothetical protein